MRANPLPGGVGDGLQFAFAADAVAAAVSQQQTQVMDFQKVGQIGRIGPAHQLFQVAKEDFARHVDAEEFFLQRFARPIGEHRDSAC